MGSPVETSPRGSNPVLQRTIAVRVCNGNATIVASRQFRKMQELFFKTYPPGNEHWITVRLYRRHDDAISK